MTLHAVYAAGPTGFVLYRRLQQLGINCIVVEPTKTGAKSAGYGVSFAATKPLDSCAAKIGDARPALVPPRLTKWSGIGQF